MCVCVCVCVQLKLEKAVAKAKKREEQMGAMHKRGAKEMETEMLGLQAKLEV